MGFASMYEDAAERYQRSGRFGPSKNSSRRDPVFDPGKAKGNPPRTFLEGPPLKPIGFLRHVEPVAPRSGKKHKTVCPHCGQRMKGSQLKGHIKFGHRGQDLDTS